MELLVEPYHDGLREQWDLSARKARQSSFLFERSFMDYHADRFHDASLVFYDAHHNVAALLPACVSREHPRRIESHGGLTFGGLLLPEGTGTSQTLHILESALSHYASLGFSEMLYKSVPHIYHTLPSEEDLYAIFRLSCTLSARAVSSAIDLKSPSAYSTLRQRKVRKAEKLQCLTSEWGEKYLPSFWEMLDAVLRTRHHVRPVHTLSELQLLSSRCAPNIQLAVALAPSSKEDKKEVVAGCLLFVSANVVHAQYIAASDRGCEICALDWLFDQILCNAPSRFPRQRYFDFGISTERGGTYLNEGLIFQKEGFGAHAVCYDHYLLKF